MSTPRLPPSAAGQRLRRANSEMDGFDRALDDALARVMDASRDQDHQDAQRRSQAPAERGGPRAAAEGPTSLVGAYDAAGAPTLARAEVQSALAVPAAAEPSTRKAAVRLGVGAVLLLALVAAAVAVLISMMVPQGVGKTLDTAAAAGPESPAAPATTSPESVPPTADGPSIFVHVVGAVKEPGLIELPAGARLTEAVTAAGGFSKKADRSTVNLARLLTDGEQIIVARKGAGSNDAGASTGAKGAQGEGTSDSTTSGGAPVAAGAGAIVNINTATVAELEELPGVGPAIAGRIVQWREENGAFTAPEDLLAVSGIGDKTLAAFIDLIAI